MFNESFLKVNAGFWLLSSQAHVLKSKPEKNLGFEMELFSGLVILSFHVHFFINSMSSAFLIESIDWEFVGADGLEPTVEELSVELVLLKLSESLHPAIARIKEENKIISCLMSELFSSDKLDGRLVGCPQ
jgi:hypothetical protein